MKKLLSVFVATMLVGAGLPIFEYVGLNVERWMESMWGGFIYLGLCIAFFAWAISIILLFTYGFSQKRQDAFLEIMDRHTLDNIPKDGTRILLLRVLTRYDSPSGEVIEDGEQWVEGWWDGKGKVWREWLGNKRMKSTGDGFTVLAWSPTPDSH